MRKTIICCLLLFLASNMFAQQSPSTYDSALATRLKADEYGMKHYVLVLLKPGSNTAIDKASEDSIFRGHLNNIGRLADEGKMVVAGPFGNNDSYRGLFILNVSNFDDAKKLLSTDPAIKANLLEPELYVWYGSAAMQEVVPIHKKIQKVNF